MVRRRQATITGLAGAMLALSACWPVPGQNPDRTAHNGLESALTPETVGGLTELWVGATGDGRALRDPIVAGGGIVVTTGTGLHRFRRATGALDWTWPTEYPDFVEVGSPFLVDDLIFVGAGTTGGGGYWTGTWLDVATGETVREHGGALVQSVRGSTAVGLSGGMVIAGGPWTNLTTVNLETGASTERLLDLEGPPSPTRALTLGRDRIYSSGAGVGENPPVLAVAAYPVAPDPIACPPPYPGVEVPCPIWSTVVGGMPTAPVIGPDETEVYVGTQAGTVVALDAATGAVHWTVDVGAPVNRPPALAEGVLYTGTTAGTLVAIDAHGCGATTCTPLWTATGGPAPIAFQPAVAGTGTDAVVYLGATDGTIRAYAADGCGERSCSHALWTANAGGPITGGPIISGGHLYVGTRNGRLVAYGLPPA